jgi:hypothetical protein
MKSYFGASVLLAAIADMPQSTPSMEMSMRPMSTRMQTTLTVTLSLVAALMLTLLASSAFAHTGADGGGHHDSINMSHHLSDLEAWLATLSMGTWLVMPLVLGLCAWWTVRRLQKKTKRTSSSSQKATHKDQP